jgi:uncharacterized coiled-coil protein SlyX
MTFMENEQEKVDGVEATGSEIDSLKLEKESLARELKSRDDAIAKLEQALAGKDSEVTAMKQALDDTTQKLKDMGEVLPKAVAAYKEIVAQANPGILAEMINGDTIEGINESLKNARALVERVRQEVGAEAARVRVPAGAPQRTPLDMSALSPREKIQYALGATG